jgi:hypothetical protein
MGHSLRVNPRLWSPLRLLDTPAGFLVRSLPQVIYGNYAQEGEAAGAPSLKNGGPQKPTTTRTLRKQAPPIKPVAISLVMFHDLTHLSSTSVPRRPLPWTHNNASC